MVGRSGTGAAEQAATAPLALASGTKRQPVGPRAALGDEEVAGPDLARVHGDARHLDVRPVQRKGEGAGQVGEKDRGLGEGVGGV